MQTTLHSIDISNITAIKDALKQLNERELPDSTRLNVCLRAFRKNFPLRKVC